LVGKPEGRDHVEDQGIKGRIIITMDLTERGWKAVDLCHLMQDRDHWWALVNTATNLQVP
jgi:hypothetical protein